MSHLTHCSLIFKRPVRAKVMAEDLARVKAINRHLIKELCSKRVIQLTASYKTTKTSDLCNFSR